MHRIEYHAPFPVRPQMPRDHRGLAADHDFANRTADLHLVMGIGHRHRGVVAAIAHHEDRRRPRTDLIARVIGHRRHRHQRVEIPHEPFANSFGMAAERLVLVLQALLFQLDIQVIEAVETGNGNKEVPPPIADHALDVAFVIPLARASEPVVKQAV